MLYQVIHYLFCHIDRDGKAYALCIRDYSRVDAYYVAVKIDKRASAVSRVDRCVRLEEALEVHVGSLQGPVFG